MRRRSVLLILLLAACVTIAVIGPCASKPRSNAPVAPAAPPSSIAPAPEALSSAEPATEVRRSTDLTTTKFEPIPRFGEGPVRLRIVERGSDAGIPGARVTFMNTGPRHRRFVNDGPRWIGPGGEKWMLANGESVRTDLNGEVMIPPGPEDRFVCARKDDWFGVDHIKPFEAGERRLELDRQHSLEVRVVDDRGLAVVGAAVGVRVRHYEGDLYPITTDAEGRVRIDNLTAILRTAGFEDEHAVEVCVEFPGQPRISEWIDPARLPAAPILLTLPATGWLRVEVMNARNEPVHEAGTFFVSRSLPAPVQAPSQPVKEKAQLEAADVSAARIPVPIGTDLQLVVALEDGGSAAQVVRALRTRGEEQRAELRLPAGLSFAVEGRILDEQDRALRNATLSGTRFNDLNDGSGYLPIQTDDAGRFRITRWAESIWILERPRERSSLGAVLDLRNLSKTGTHDLGDVKLTRMSASIVGRIEDESGRPIAGARAQVGWRDKTLGIRRTFASFHPTNTMGEFHFYLPCLDMEWQLSAAFDNSALRPTVPSAPCPCGTPEQVQVLTMKTLGRIEGTAVCDDDKSFEEIELRLQTQRARARGTISGGKFRFYFEGVEPGTHTVAVHRRNDDAPMLELSGITVQAGMTTHDPRLEPLDVRTVWRAPAAREFEVAVVDETGAALSHGESWLCQDGHGGCDREPWAAGRVRIPANGIESIAVWAPHHRLALVATKDFAGPVVLGPEHAVDVAVDLPLALAGPDFRLFIQLERRFLDAKYQGMHELLDAQRLASALDVAGAAHFSLAVPATYEISLAVFAHEVRTGTDAFIGKWKVEGPSSNLGIEAASGTQHIQARLQADDVDTILRVAQDVRKR